MICPRLWHKGRRFLSARPVYPRAGVGVEEIETMDFPGTVSIKVYINEGGAMSIWLLPQLARTC